MNQPEQYASPHAEFMQTSLLVFMEEIAIAIVIFIFWLWLMIRVSRALRTTKSGVRRDGGMLLVLMVAVLAVAGAVMTNIIYLDIKRAVFGTINHSYLQAVF